MGLREEEGRRGGLPWDSGEKPWFKDGSSAALRVLGVRSEQGPQKSSCEAG